MGKFYCEYCDIYLTHSSTNGRKQHNSGRKHINNKIDYYKNVIMAPGFNAPLLFDSEFNVVGHLGNLKQFIQNNSNNNTGVKRSFSTINKERDGTNKNIPNKRSNVKQGSGFHLNNQQNDNKYIYNAKNTNIHALNSNNSNNNNGSAQSSYNRGTRYVKKGFNNISSNNARGSSGNNNYSNINNNNNYNVQNQPQSSCNYGNNSQSNNNQRFHNKHHINHHNVLYNHQDDHNRVWNSEYGIGIGRIGNNTNIRNIQ
ncbi:hypothetical protein FG379_000045 [Cryptosporidium bovis]|uniref:uncharacterized protein n=1 Tax=Cryptosporidium bovis TaxID=310047 RepID=UPI00351AA14B|nr:hypothetical protein FG379_000045 [Cryptosporidium bovis]